MQQSDKQIRREYTKLFGGIPIEGTPGVIQKRKMVLQNNKQNKELIELISGGDIVKANYITSMTVAEVYRIMNDFLSKSKKH